MQYISHYQSPLGDILLAADGTGLTGLWFEGQKYFALHLDHNHVERSLPVFEDAKRQMRTALQGRPFLWDKKAAHIRSFQLQKRSFPVDTACVSCQAA